MAADQFCLRWNNFQVNITSALESLKCDEDLVDVTLTCDGQNVKAHKVILSACSPYFRNVFRENPCQHPVVILKDVSYEDVTALLNFMYQGEVYITQDRLAPFLHTAELLQVRGLAGATNPFKESQSPSHQQQQQPHHQPQPQQKPHHQQKLKKQHHASAGQLRRVTSPLSISPSSIPHQTPNKPVTYASPFRVSKSPLVSPTSKDSHTTSIPAFHLKEKSIVSHSYTLNRESDSSHPKSHSQSNAPVPLIQSSPANYSTSNEQSSSSYQPALSEQQPFSSSQLHQSLTTPTTYQQHTSEPSPTTPLQFPPIPHDEHSSSQPSSPQPTATKRRKTFPRRLSSSSSHAPTDEPTLSSDGSSERPKAPSGSGEDQAGFEVVKVVPGNVKQEPVDDDGQEDETHDEDMDMTSRQSADSEDMEVTGFYNNPEMDSENPVSMDENIVKEESVAEGTSDVSPHSMLLRSLAGVQVQQADDVGSRPSIHQHRSLWRCMQPRLCPICFKTFSNSFNLKQHVQNVHLPSQGIQCPVCRKAFKNKRYLRKHLVTFHGAPLRRIRTQDDRFMSRPCPLCNKIISNKSNLLKHMRIRHSGQCKQQQCPSCEKIFKNKYSLKVHMYTYHRADRPQQARQETNTTFPAKPANLNPSVIALQHFSDRGTREDTQ